MLVEWLEFHWMISEVVERLKEVVQAEQAKLVEAQANSIFHYFRLDLAVKVAWQQPRPVDFAIDFGNWLPKPSVASTTEIPKNNNFKCLKNKSLST